MTFKQKLNEDAAILLEYRQHPISELIAYGGIPLDPGMMDRLGFLERDQMSYHLTNSKYIEDMAKSQGKKKQISTFTQGGPELARLPSQPNLLLLLNGTTVIRGETDIWTLVSTRDRRWMDIKAVGKYASKLSFLIKGVIQSVANKVEIDVDIYKIKKASLATMIENLQNKDKVSFYRLYLTEMEAMLNKNYKVLIDYMKTAADMKYNEVVLTKWKIVDAWCLEYEQPSVIEQLKKLNIQYAGVMARRDLSSLQL